MGLKIYIKAFTIDNLNKAILKKPKILHIISHGRRTNSKEGQKIKTSAQLEIENEDGELQLIDKKLLDQILET